MIKYSGKKEEVGPCRIFVEADGQINRLKHIERHSPDGMQMGYSGSGCADTALSILHDFCQRTGINSQVAEEYYQTFKSHFIAKCKDGLSITGEEIENWMKLGGIV